MRPLLLAIAALAILAPVVGSAPPRKRSVELRGLAFKPGKVEVRRGGTVTWTWNDGSNSHDVKSKGAKRFRSSPVMQRGTHRVTFRRSGTYRYVCSIHPNMRGSVVVR